MKRKTLLQKGKEAFLNAPATHMLRAILIVTAILSGSLGVALGGGFIYSACAGLVVLSAGVWYFARKARLCRERAAREYAL